MDAKPVNNMPAAMKLGQKTVEHLKEDDKSIFPAINFGKAIGESLAEIVKEGPIGKIVDKVKDKFSEEG